MPVKDIKDPNMHYSTAHILHQMSIKMDVSDPNYLERTLKRHITCPLFQPLDNDAQICLHYRFPSTKTYLFTTKNNCEDCFDLNAKYDSKTEPKVERSYGYAGN